jgi:hypothetical protein
VVVYENVTIKILSRYDPKRSFFILSSIPSRPPPPPARPPASKDGGQLEQLVLYRYAPASDFLGGKTLEAECPFTWRSVLYKDYFRWCTKIMIMRIIKCSRWSVRST